MRQALGILWASPNTLLGLAAGGLVLLTGGGAQVRQGVLEFHGGAARWWLARLFGGGILALTLGHVVVGHSLAALDLSRDHERVHVRQYERWGPLFLPAYAWCSFVAWWQGKRAYRDNYFEREAYDESPCS